MKKLIKNNFRPVTFLLTFLLLAGCEKIAMKPNPGTDNISIYNEFWKIMDEKYALWDNPQVPLDKDSLHQVTSQAVDNTISRDSLMHVFGIIINAIKDGHSWVEDAADPDFYVEYKFYEDVPSNLDQEVVDKYYLGNDYKTAGDVMKYTLLEDSTIGYIQVRSWSGDPITDADMDEVLNYMKDTKGIIFDVRGNGGGDPLMSNRVARHFTDEKIYLGYERFKTGPGPNDFSPSDQYLTPSPGIHYTKPLMVLTNIVCFSATTLFIYELRYLPQVKFIGARTGGGSGSVADGFLANGWHWQTSVSEFIDKDGRHYNNGMDPDIPVSLDTLDTSHDEIIDRAIREILESPPLKK